MTIRSAMILVTLAIAGGSAMAAMPGAPAAQWQHLVVPGTGLAVDMPGTPVKGDDINVDGLRNIAYRVERDEAHAYGVRAEQMPAGRVAQEGVDGLLNETRDSLIADGTLRAERTLPERGGAVGKAVIIDSAETTGSGAYTIVAHIYLRGDWLYLLLATVPRGGENDALARRFLNSARFLGK